MSSPVVTGERLRRLSVAANTSRQLAGDDREARDRAIEEADQAGMSVREIARATGLAPGHVHRIITARAAARQA